MIIFDLVIVNVTGIIHVSFRVKTCRITLYIFQPALAKLSRDNRDVSSRFRIVYNDTELYVGEEEYRQKVQIKF